MVFAPSITSLSYSFFFVFFLHPSETLLAAIVISSHVRKTINVSLEEFKGKETFFVRE